MLPRVNREVQLAHEYGIPYGYTLTTGVLPMLDNIRGTGADVLVGLDPLQQGADPLTQVRDKLSDQMCLWGGVNGAITVEEGTEAEVREAVHQALDVMRDVNGFILSPVDNITESTLKAWQDVDVFIDAWKDIVDWVGRSANLQTDTAVAGFTDRPLYQPERAEQGDDRTRV